MKNPSLPVALLALLGSSAGLNAAEPRCKGLDPANIAAFKATLLKTAKDAGLEKIAIPADPSAAADGFPQTVKDLCDISVWKALLHQENQNNKSPFNDWSLSQGGSTSQEFMVAYLAALMTDFDQRTSEFEKKVDQIESDSKDFTAEGQVTDAASAAKVIELLPKLIAKKSEGGAKHDEAEIKAASPGHSKGGSHFEGAAGSLEDLLAGYWKDFRVKAQSRMQTEKEWNETQFRLKYVDLVPALVKLDPKYDERLKAAILKANKALNAIDAKLGAKSPAELKAELEKFKTGKEKETAEKKALDARTAKLQGVVSQLDGQVDDELLKRIFDNEKKEGRLKDVKDVDEWKTKNPDRAKALIMVARRGAPGKLVVGPDGNEILYRREGKDDVKVELPADLDKAKPADYEASVKKIADHILSFEPAKAKKEAAKAGLDKALDDPKKAAEKAVEKGGMFGMANLGPEAYTQEELKDKAEKERTRKAGERSAQRTGILGEAQDEQNRAKTDWAAAKDKCIDENITDQAKQDECLRLANEAYETRKKKAIAAAQVKMKGTLEKPGPGFSADEPGIEVERGAKDKAEIDAFWNKQFEAYLDPGKAEGGSILAAAKSRAAGLKYVKAAEIEAYYTKTWVRAAQREGDDALAFTTRMADLKDKVLKVKGGRIGDTVQSAVIDGTDTTEGIGPWSEKLNRARAEAAAKRKGEVAAPDDRITEDTLKGDK